MNIKTIHVHIITPKNRSLGYGLSELELAARSSGAFSLDPSVSPCGYHWIVRRDGTVEVGRPEDMPGNHTPGCNKDALGVAIINSRGGRFTGRKQREAYRELMVGILQRYPGSKLAYLGAP